MRRRKQEAECRRISARLWDLRDGQLQASDADAISRHLDACPACAAELRFVDIAKNAAGTIVDRTPSSKRGWDEISAALPQNSPSHHPHPIRSFAWVGAAAVVILAGWLAWPSVNRKPTKQGLEFEGIPPLKVDNAAPISPLAAGGKPSTVADAKSLPKPMNLVATERAWAKKSFGRRPGASRQSVETQPMRGTQLIAVNRSSEMPAAVIATNDISPTLVSGTVPSSSDAETMSLVSGSAPAADSSDEPAVSHETAWNEEPNR